MRQADRDRMSADWPFLCLCLLAIALFVVGHPTRESSRGQATTEKLAGPDPSPIRKSSIFDFFNYKRLFNKVYSGLLEQAVRMTYFFARASRVFISAVKYRSGQQPYYFAINKYSDASPGELDRMRNKVLDQQAGVTVSKRAEAPSSVDIDQANLEKDVENSLRKLAKDNFKLLNKYLDESSDLKRNQMQRDVPSKDVRDLPLDKLIRIGSLNVQPEPEIQPQDSSANQMPNSDNLAAHKPSDEQLHRSNSLVEAQKPVEVFYRPSKKSSDSVELGFQNIFAGDPKVMKDPLPDEVFLDLRTTTKCFTKPRDQGFCGSCYAFAAIAIAEWLYCMETGKLTRFSEQYMIDCGKKYIEGLYGCDGGSAIDAGTFMHNFGLELRANYPYLHGEIECRYGQDKALNTTGYIRTNMPVMYEMSLKELAHSLKNGPVYAIIPTDESFHEYGGGVHGIRFAGTQSLHGVAVVGHGRESGREYWLIRNSFGVDWGEDGYYKLDKSVDGISDRVVYAFGTKNRHGSKMNAYTNPDHTPIRLTVLDYIKPRTITAFKQVKSQIKDQIDELLSFIGKNSLISQIKEIHKLFGQKGRVN